MSLLGGGGPSAIKHIRAVCNHKTKHGFKERRMTHAHTYYTFTYRSMDIIWCQQAFLRLFQTLQLLFCKDFETQLSTIPALPYYITVRVWFQSFLLIVILQAREQSTTFFCPFLCTTNKPWPFMLQFSCLIRQLHGNKTDAMLHALWAHVLFGHYLTLCVSRETKQHSKGFTSSLWGHTCLFVKKTVETCKRQLISL